VINGIWVRQHLCLRLNPRKATSSKFKLGRCSVSLIIPQTILFSAPVGKSALPLVELDKTKVIGQGKTLRLRKGSKKRLSADCSFGDFVGHLEFSAWRFFHAAEKTELARSFSVAEADRRAFAFALEHEGTFIWDTDNFRKTDAAVFALEDFASSGLAGRVGEAIAYLTMVEWGYVFWDRCSTVWERAARHANISHAYQLRVAKYLSRALASGKPANEPDFLFEKFNGEVALMEAKGSFVDPGTDKPSTKDDLRQALKQLTAWSKVIDPAPKKLLGIGTYLREENDSGDDPSLVGFVDPAGQQRSKLRRVTVPTDLIRRCNYGAWLVGMGLVGSGKALRDMSEKRSEEISLPVVRVANRSFAVAPIGWESLQYEQGGWFWELALPHLWLSRASWLVIGIETNTLDRVGEAIRKSGESLLLQIEAPVEVDPDAPLDVPWSIMPDGSFVGMFTRDSLIEGFQEMKTFKL
jgi:hypothetical protein